MAAVAGAGQGEPCPSHSQPRVTMACRRPHLARGLVLQGEQMSRSELSWSLDSQAKKRGQL